VHPKDAWGPAFTKSRFAQLYDEGPPQYGKYREGAKLPLRKLLAMEATQQDPGVVVAAFAQWSRSRRTFLKPFVNKRGLWSSALTNEVYSAQLWQLVKTWEMTQEFGLEERGREFCGSARDLRAWCNTIPRETAPSETHIPSGPAGVGGSALTNEYFTAAWYQLQVVLNSGNHQHRDRMPVDWMYLIGQFQDLYDQTHEPEPTRLLVMVIKALQSTDPELGPDNLREG